MRIRIFAGMIFSALLLAACEEGPAGSSYTAVLPELPGPWREILGEAHWRIEWINEEGIRREHEIPPGGESPALSLIQEWTSPVLAWPFWPGRGLYPGMMRPGGALFPWDVSGEKLLISWKGGVEAFLWKELAAAEMNSSAAKGRLPWYFDWPRFRELMESGNIPEAVRMDPWLAAWKEIAQKTVESGFSGRRVVPQKMTELLIPGAGGRWIGSSPFALPLETGPGASLVLNVTGIPDTWVSEEEILKCSVSGWVFRGIPK